MDVLPGEAQGLTSPALRGGRAVADDVPVTRLTQLPLVLHRYSTVISAVGVLAATVLLVGAVLQYRDGASLLWVVLGGVIFLSAVLTLVGDVRHSRRRPSGEWRTE